MDARQLFLGDLRTVDVCSHRRTRRTRSYIIIHLATKLIVELKSVEHTSKLHLAQLLTYMKLAEAPIGLLINWGAHVGSTWFHQDLARPASYSFFRFSLPTTLKLRRTRKNDSRWVY